MNRNGLGELDEAVWTQNGMRQLILGNNQLSEIVLRPHPFGISEEWPIYNIGFYSFTINNGLNGSRWKVESDSKCCTFR